MTEGIERRPPRFIEDPVATTEHCRYSLMCRHVCPVGQVTHRETLTPHGWALMIASIRRGLLAWNEETVDILYRCADCGLCQAHCATAQPLPAAIAAARGEVVQAGLAPEPVVRLDQALLRWSNPYQEQAPEKGKGMGKLGVFVGDAGHYLCSSNTEAAFRLLRSLGIEAVPLGRGRSNGHLASSLGLNATAVRLAQAVIREVEEAGCGTVVVLAPSDLYAFRFVYPERLNVSWPENVEVVELTAFLHQAYQGNELSLQAGGTRQVYAYHDPCHSPRVGRNHQAVKDLLAAALGEPPVPLFWREQRAHPCGAVGGLEWTHKELAAQLARSRLEDVRQAGAQVVYTEDPLCLHHLSQHAGSGLEVKGVYELLAERIKGTNR